MIQQIVNSSINKYLEKLNKKNISLNGIIEESSLLIALFLALNNKNNTIIVVSSNDSLSYLYEISKVFNHKKHIYCFPSMLDFPYQMVSPNKSILTSRINSLINLTTNSQNNIVLATSASFLEKTLAQKYLENRFFFIKTKEKINTNSLISFLVSNNYKNTTMVMEENQFSIRGDIIDIYSSSIGAIRIDLFDDIVEKIKLFDIYTQKTTGFVEECMINPSSEIILEKEFINNFKFEYKNYFHKNNDILFDQLDNQIAPKGIENYLGLFYQDKSTIEDFVKNPDLVLLNDVKLKMEEHINHYEDEYNYLNNQDSIFKNELDILKPKDIILSQEELEDKLNQHNTINLNYFKRQEDQGNINVDVKQNNLIISSYKNSNNSKTTHYNGYLLKLIKEQIVDNNIIIFAATHSFYTNVTKQLDENSIIYNDNYANSTGNSIKIIKNCPIHNGFIIENNIFISEYEITGAKKTYTNPKRINNKKFLEHLSAISIGDIVVHSTHGLGKYYGITTLNTNGSEHDFLEIHYQNNEKLYIPVENIDTISRYSSNQESVSLDKLGSNSFEKKHNKIKEKIRDIAYELIATAAKRKTNQTLHLEYNIEAYEQFSNEFPYVETDDQLKAIEDVINDFKSGYPSDRLVCGDVGFGKTEIAMRAAFIIASSGKTVALITPTTLLCRQHYNNFKERFKNFPINIAQLSRFVTTKDKKKIKEDLKEGKIDIIIGTHSLLASSLEFKDLGLIIIDEEQSFGVLHKEKLKKIINNAHIVTLSATPIPRTIQLALKGIKDLSLIATPPVNKLPINTYTLPYELITIKNAISKELERGGQVYFVCPRIANLNELKNCLNLLQFNNYVLVHGQMSPQKIEDNMIAFQNKEYDILLSTNIIESGLDLENVNTIIIEQPELFGLAQLYQLRGRVGRGKNQAYAYMLYNKNKHLKPNAQKRLQILQNLDYLGAGFALASYDLDMRGAGNIIGEEQSGHIKEIGFDMYQKLLEKEIYNLKNNITEEEEDSNFSTDINLGIPVLLPKKYIANIETAIEIYQRIGQIKEIEEIEELRDEMVDRFGKIPPQVENLFTSINLKIKCKKAFVEKITFGPKGILLGFYQKKFKEVDKLIEYIQSSKGKINFKPDGKIFLNTINLDIKEQINQAYLILRDLANLLDN